MMWRDSQVSCQIHQRWKFHSNQYLALNSRNPGSVYRLVFLSVSFFPCSISQWRVSRLPQSRICPADRGSQATSHASPSTWRSPLNVLFYW
jgi:hypothetical protein